MLGGSRDGQGLSRKGLPQERLKRWRQRIVRPLQRGIHLNDACPEFLRETSKIFVIVIHGGTPEDGSVQTKNGGLPAVGGEGVEFCGGAVVIRLRRATHVHRVGRLERLLRAGP